MNYKHTESGDLMHTHECNENNVTYGLISIQFKNAYACLNDAERVLIAFIEQLKPVFSIQHATSVKTEIFQNNKTAVTIYWQDADTLDWKVKGWTDGETLAVLYIKNIGAVAVATEELFLNGSFLA